MSLAAESRTAFAGDTFRRAVSATFGWNVAQRVLGLVRTLLFVVWLAPTELGRWTVVQTLLVFAAPLVVLGLPGSFGRQVEQFRQRGQLAGYLRRTLTASGGLVAGAAIAGWVYAEPLAARFLHDVAYVDSLRASVWVLVAAVLFQSSQEFLTSVHQAARAARWQLVSAALFLLFGGLFSFAPVIASTRSAFGWPPHVGVIAAYGLSLLVPSVAAWWSLARSEELWRDQHNPLDVANWLAQVAPFALGVWVTNVVASGFDGALVYGLKRWSALSPAGTDALVGHLFTARVVPTLLAGLAGMLCGVVVPYLSRDWESGGREAVFRRLRETLHGFAAVYTTVAAVTLVVGPSAAHALAGPKHDVALTLLPWSLAMGGAFSQLSLAQTYFWCLGRTWLTSLALAVGLVTSLALLSITVPHADVAGAVAAGAVGHVVALVIVMQLVQRHGLPLDAWTLLAVFLPLAPGLGPIPAACAACIAWISWSRFARRCSDLAYRWLRPLGRRAFDNGERNTESSLGDTLVHGSPHESHELRGSHESRASHESRGSQTSHDERVPRRTVVFLATSLPVGGAETLLAELVRRIDATRFRCEIVCLKQRGELGERLAAELPVTEGLLRHKYDLFVIARLRRLFLDRDVAAVVTVGAGDKMFWGRIAAWLAGVPAIIAAIHSTGWPDRIGWLNRRLTWLTDAFVAVAPSHQRYLVEHERLPAARVTVISNGVDTQRFSPPTSGPSPSRPERHATSLRNELGISSEARVGAIVAALRPEKNHLLFVEAARLAVAKQPDARLLIIGDGPERPSIERAIRDAGLTEQVRLLGVRHDLPELLAECDVVTLTSRIEANPVSLLEAMAAGVPVVAARVGAVPDTVIHDVTGLLVEPGDARGLADGWLAIWHDSTLANRLATAARRHVVQHASVQQMVGGYEQLLDRLWS